MTPAEVIQANLTRQAGWVTVNLGPLLALYGAACAASKQVDPEQMLADLFDSTPMAHPEGPGAGTAQR